MTNQDIERLFSLKLHWIKLGEDGVIELYLDNHMMQTFRMCESRGYLDFIDGYQSKAGHFWALDFGTCVHKMIEIYYQNYRDPKFDVLNWAGNQAAEYWNYMNMDELYNDKSPYFHKNYNLLAGFMGFSQLLLEYAQQYHSDNERFRVIGTELYFGKDKSVFLGQVSDRQNNFRLYLCGKIDILVDDGSNIGPMDHKTASAFMGKNPIVNYEVHEGMTGYVFATKKLLKNILKTSGRDESEFLRDEYLSTRTCSKIWMNFIQVKPEKLSNDRFKRCPLFVTDYQLEQYRLRQISTATRILDLLLNPDMLPIRNTMVCTNYMHYNCTYQGVHRQNSKESELIQLNADFVKGSIWNPEERDNKEAKELSF